jgi:hypothetical protein
MSREENKSDRGALDLADEGFDPRFGTIDVDRGGIDPIVERSIQIVKRSIQIQKLSSQIVKPSIRILGRSMCIEERSIQA